MARDASASLAEQPHDAEQCLCGILPRSLLSSRVRDGRGAAPLRPAPSPPLRGRILAFRPTPREEPLDFNPFLRRFFPPDHPKMAEFAAKTVSVIASMEKGLFIDGAFVEGLRKETWVFGVRRPA